MKTMKKLFALVLALAMVLALSCTAFAAKITVTNPQMKFDVQGIPTADADTYKAYKIFTLVKNGDSYSYTLDSTSAAYNLLTNANNATAIEAAGVTLTATQQKYSSDKVIYEATVAANKADEFAKWLKTNEASLTRNGIDGTASKDKVEIDVGSDLGYYFVTTTTGAVANLTTAEKDLEIKDKNEIPDITKTVDDADKSVEVGQVVTYTITGTVPDTTGYEDYRYVVTDKMSEGLTFNKNVTNTLDAEVTAKYGENAKINTDDTTTYDFVLEFDMTQYQSKVGQTFTITYTATVNEKAIQHGFEKNTATLSYSNDPTDWNNTKPTTPDEVKVQTAKIVVDKYYTDGNSANQPLAGATFVLENAEGKFYKYDTTEKKVTWVNTEAEADHKVTAIDSNKAYAEFTGLAAGTYSLVETAAPAGYNKLLDPVSVTVKSTADTQAVATAYAVTEPVENKSGTILPETGSIGTIGLTAVGVLVVAAGVMFMPKKKENQ